MFPRYLLSLAKTKSLIGCVGVVSEYGGDVDLDSILVVVIVGDKVGESVIGVVDFVVYLSVVIDGRVVVVVLIVGIVVGGKDDDEDDEGGGGDFVVGGGGGDVDVVVVGAVCGGVVVVDGNRHCSLAMMAA